MPASFLGLSLFLFCSNMVNLSQLADEISMSGQPAFGTAKNGQAFFRWEQAGKHLHRLFFAILVGSAIAGRLARKAIALNREFGLQGWLVPENHIHISLVGLGGHEEYPQELVETACHIGSMIVAKPFEVSFDRLSAFGGGALVLRGSDGNPSLQKFWRDLTAVISDSPLKPFLTRSIEPHVTLLRDEVGVPRIRERSIDPVGWTVRDFVLIHSLIGKGAYKQPGRWRLTGQDDALPAM
jgi:RNA 2',3'-cyclic 3'-phosphodiesterase